MSSQCVLVCPSPAYRIPSACVYSSLYTRPASQCSTLVAEYDQIRQIRRARKRASDALRHYANQASAARRSLSVRVPSQFTDITGTGDTKESTQTGTSPEKQGHGQPIESPDQSGNPKPIMDTITEETEEARPLNKLRSLSSQQHGAESTPRDKGRDGSLSSPSTSSVEQVSARRPTPRERSEKSATELPTIASAQQNTAPNAQQQQQAQQQTSPSSSSPRDTLVVSVSLPAGAPSPRDSDAEKTRPEKLSQAASTPKCLPGALLSPTTSAHPPSSSAFSFSTSPSKTPSQRRASKGKEGSDRKETGAEKQKETGAEKQKEKEGAGSEEKEKEQKKEGADFKAAKPAVGVRPAVSTLAPPGRRRSSVLFDASQALLLVTAGPNQQTLALDQSFSQFNPRAPDDLRARWPYMRYALYSVLLASTNLSLRRVVIATVNFTNVFLILLLTTAIELFECYQQPATGRWSLSGQASMDCFDSPDWWTLLPFAVLRWVEEQREKNRGERGTRTEERGGGRTEDRGGEEQ